MSSEATTGRDTAVPSVFDALRSGVFGADFWLPRCCALLAAAIGPLPLVLDLRWSIAMASTGPVLWGISVALVVAAGVLAHRHNDRILLRTLFVALLGGTLATNTYDTFRFSGFSAGIIAMDEAGDFGGRLTGQIPPGPMHHGTGQHQTGTSMPAESSAMHGSDHDHAEGKAATPVKTILIGYAWHIWAGIMFSLAFLVLFGARNWWLPIAYMLFFIYPGMVFAMGAHSTANFIWEAAGHAAFGATLGAVSWSYLSRRAA